MKLSDDEVEGALYCVSELVEHRRRAGVPVPDWMIDLLRHLDLTSAMSPRGHEFDSDGAQSDTSLLLIGTREAADLLGRSPRQIRRLSADLDGEIVGGRLVFRHDTVIEYMEGRRSA